MPRCARKTERAICSECYRTLPDEKRYAITRAWIADMTIETVTVGMQHAIRDADSWVLAMFGGESREKYDPGRWARLCAYVRDRDEARRARLAETPVRHLKLVP